MNHLSQPIEPRRPEDSARMEIALLRVEDGSKLDEVFRKVTMLAAKTLNVERMGVWLFVNKREALRCTALYELSKDSYSSGTTLEVRDFPDYFAALARRKTVAAELATTDPRTSPLAEVYFMPLGITSTLDAAIFVGGEIVGVVCCEHVGPPREWSTEDRDFVGSMADVLATKIRAAEAADLHLALRVQASQLAEARRLESLAQMAAGVGHDFKNVLTVISVHAELLATGGGSPEENRDSARSICEAVEHGVVLASELMDFAKPGPNSARVLRPSDLVKEQLGLLQSAAGDYPVKLEIRSDAGRVFISVEHIHRLVLNLVVNARDAMEKPGPIVVALDVVQTTDDDGKPGTFVVIEVTDRGTGIPDDVLPRIFDPFFTTKPRGKGTGLGLAIVNQVVSTAGGFLRVKTALGAGTTFQVYLPRVSI